MTAVVLEVGNVVTGHDDLRMPLKHARTLSPFV
jgi:hypothetical protein